NIEISGFSDEISSELDTQLKIVSELGMRYISLRGVDGENISEYSVESIQNNVLPRLKQWGIGISSIGSPIGKIYINDDDEFEEEVIVKLKQFAEIAQQYNIVLLHENEKDIFGDIARRCNTILNEVGSKNFKAIFDFANFVQCGEDTQACYELLSHHIEYIHIKDAVYKDNVNVLCGSGDGQIKSILKQIFNSGYKGFLTLEPHLVVFDSLKD